MNNIPLIRQLAFGLISGFNPDKTLAADELRNDIRREIHGYGLVIFWHDDKIIRVFYTGKSTNITDAIYSGTEQGAAWFVINRLVEQGVVTLESEHETIEQSNRPRGDTERSQG